MSTTAIGPPPLRRPGAPSMMERSTARTRSPTAPAARSGCADLQRFATTGKARIGHEILVCVEGQLVFLEDDALRGSVRQDPPALLVVGEIGDHDLAEDLLVDGRIEDGHDRLDPAVEVARHHVGRADEDLGFRRRQAVAVAEAIDAGVLEEAPDDRLHADALGQAGNAGPETADAAHDEVDLDAGLAGVVERVDDLRIDQRVHLHPDLRRAAGLGVGHFRRDETEDGPPQHMRRDRQALQRLRLRIAGDVVEDARDIAGDCRIGREERQVGVDARRDLMIVAGADMDVAGELAALAAHHQRQLGVGLQFDEAVDHLHAGALEVA